MAEIGARQRSGRFWSRLRMSLCQASGTRDGPTMAPHGASSTRGTDPARVGGRAAYATGWMHSGRSFRGLFTRRLTS